MVRSGAAARSAVSRARARGSDASSRPKACAAPARPRSSPCGDLCQPPRHRADEATETASRRWRGRPKSKFQDTGEAQGARCVFSRRGATSPRNDEEALSAESQRKPPLHGLEATSRPRQGLADLNAARLSEAAWEQGPSSKNSRTSTPTAQRGNLLRATSPGATTHVCTREGASYARACLCIKLNAYAAGGANASQLGDDPSTTKLTSWLQARSMARHVATLATVRK